MIDWRKWVGDSYCSLTYWVEYQLSWEVKEEKRLTAKRVALKIS